MHSSLLLFPAASASAAAIEPRQVDGEVYCCGGKSGFNPDDCRAAAERIPTDRTHGVAAEACCADGAGYVHHGGIRVQVDICEICGSGICTECRSPGQGPMKKRVDVTSVSHEAEEAAIVEKRQDGDGTRQGDRNNAAQF